MICVPSSVQMVSCGSSVVSHLIIGVQKMVYKSSKNRNRHCQGTTPKEISDHLWRACHSGSLASCSIQCFGIAWNQVASQFEA